MSELKAINLNSMDCYNINEPIYLKSEADKVIAEKDKVIAHQKYKRCLAMARCCNRMFSSTFGKERYWQKWNRRWLELAEKFKEV